MGDPLLIIFSGLLGGTLIGAVSVGGVIILPLLIGLGGMAPQEVVQLTLAGFIATGFVALIRARPANVISFWPMLLAAIPGAVTGTIAIRYLPPLLIVWLIAVLAASSTIFAMLPRDMTQRTFRLKPAAGVAIGLGTGVGSALTGSGGPLILTPLLTLLRLEIRPTILLAQIIQLPIALAATVTQVGHAPLNLQRTSLLAGSLVAGLLVGMALQHKVPTAWLTKMTNLAVLATIATMLVSTRAGGW